MKAIHLINRSDANTNQLRGLYKVEEEFNAYFSCCWNISAEEANQLIGGMLFLHNTKSEKSKIGGRITKVFPVNMGNLPDSVKTDIESIPDNKHRVAFLFVATHDGCNQEWRGLDHQRAWTGGVIDIPEFVSVITNPAINDLVCIGRTTNIEERLNTLSSYFDAPAPFECLYDCEIKHLVGVEQKHLIELGLRLRNSNQDFLEIGLNHENSLFQIFVEKLQMQKNISGEPVKIRVDGKKRGHKPPFTFSRANVPIGATLTFSLNATLTATVVSDKKINFKNKISYLSTIALEIMNTQFGKKWSSIHGPAYWIYDGEILDDRRDRIEKGQNE